MWLKYSNQPLSIANYQDVDQRSNAELHEFTKPLGCWITDDSEDCWRSWCIAESFRFEDLRCKHEIVLDESRILILREADELDAFSHQFGAFFEPYPSAPSMRLRILWERVAEQYDGLIITPYQWSQRMQLMWYYGWDCASGCIWKASAIREIRLIEIDEEIATRENRSKLLGISGEDAA